MDDELIGELEQENRLMRARNERLAKELAELHAQFDVIHTAGFIQGIEKAIERLEQGGQTAAVGILRHEFLGLNHD